MVTINFIDIGCAGYIPEPWDRNNCGKYINFVMGFDAFNDELNYLNEEFSNNVVYKSVVFDIEGKMPFYKCHRSRVSSLFQPNVSVLIPYIKLLNKIRAPKKYYISKYDIKEIINVECVRLDKILDNINDNFDFLKTDTEGADYNVIKSLGKYLDEQIVGIYAELYFKEMYKGIVLFHDVDDFLKRHNFYMVKRMGGVEGYWANFLYIRNDNSKKEKIDLIKKAYKI